MKIALKPFVGQHCETTATGTLLKQLGIELSEPMLFGLGEGLGFIIWNMKTMEYPFIGGRIKPDLVTENITRNLGLKLTVSETASKPKAWQTVKALLDSGKAVGLKLDCYHLEYFSHPIHFAGHYVAMTGYDETSAFLVDTAQQGTAVTTSLQSLERARSEKGPMSSKNRSYIIEKGEKPVPLENAVVQAIRNNATTYLNPPIKNLAYKGIEKASEVLLHWYDTSKNRKDEFGTTAMLMERAGTGGALFRNLYRDFLQEAYLFTGNKNIGNAYDAFVEIAQDWSEIISLFEKTAETEDRRYIETASEKLKMISTKEYSAMQLLVNI